jgi:hypothetical protein
VLDAVGVGTGSMVTTEVFVPRQAPIEPVIVYVVVRPGVAETVAPLVELNPVAGLQVKPVAPAAVSVTGVPAHAVAEFTVTVGPAGATNETVTVPRQLLLSLTPIV